MMISVERIAVVAAAVALGVVFWSGRSSAPALDPDDPVAPIAEATTKSLRQTTEIYRLQAACYQALMGNGDDASCDALNALAEAHAEVAAPTAGEAAAVHLAPASQMAGEVSP